MTTAQNPQSPGSVPKKKSPLVWILAGCAFFALIVSLATAGFLWWGYHKAKGYAEKAINSSGGMNQIADLWSDVPRMDGMTKSHQVDMPVSLKILARPVLDTMMRGVNDGKEAGHWDWTGFSIGGKTPSDVQEFYTPSRMSQYGDWQQQGGCTGAPGASAGQISFCAFEKNQKNKTTGLLIIAADDKEHSAVSIFFIRQEAQEAQSPPSQSPS